MIKLLFNEQAVLSDLQNGEPAVQRKAFEQIVNFYSENLYWKIRRMVLSHDDANDLLQNAFIKAWMSFDSFRGDAKLSTWLYKIAVNESITFLNKERAKNNVSLDDEATYLSENLTASDYFDGDEAQIKLQKAILTLPDKQRLVFNLRYFDEMPYEEMSGLLDTSVGALKASYHHASKKVEDFLQSD
ncbi:MAG: sigma-70 family RNA polymerase sigma factor [Candidatus Symbiothrix sp.]|jgi:RNA polymerase sigma-70 factor (ECF subfamily)|nr:sigma-70 family RNA polymerase sigma factor [Candidatus Symbiothrix sp.]